MWKPNYIHFKRVLSHTDSRYVFQNGIAIPVIGINETDEGQKSNGSGKSAIIEAVITGLRGEPFRFKSAKDIVQDDEKGCEIDFELEHADGDVIRIYRKIMKKGSSKVELYRDGEIDKDLKDLHPRETNKAIEEALGISFEDIANYYILSNEDHKPFFLSTDGKKKETINRFSKANVVDVSIDKVGVDIAAKEKNLRSNENEQIKTEGTLEVIEEDILDLKESISHIESNHNKKIAAIKDDISNMEEAIKSVEQDISKSKKDLATRKEALSDNSTESLTPQIKKLEDKLSELRKEEKELRKEEKEVFEEEKDLNKKKREIEVKLSGEIECPHCKDTFIPGGESDTSDLKEDRDSITADLKEVDTDKKDLSEDIKYLSEEKEGVEDDIDKLQKKVSAAKKIEDGIAEYESIIKSKENRLRTKESGLVDLNNNLSTLEKTDVLEDPYTPQIEAKELKIVSLNKEWDDLKEKYSKIESEIESTKVWEGRLKRFKSHLANQAINTIEGYTNSYLEKIHTNLQVQISGFRLLADGKTIKEEIEIGVLRDGLPVGVFKRFSGGEKARINICNILAMQQIINDTSETGGLNLLLLDEVTESLDYLGISEIINALSSLKKTVLLINHVRDQSFENELVVCKQDGESKLGKLIRSGMEEKFEPFEYD